MAQSGHRKLPNSRFRARIPPVDPARGAFFRPRKKYTVQKNKVTF